MTEKMPKSHFALDQSVVLCVSARSSISIKGKMRNFSAQNIHIRKEKRRKAEVALELESASFVLFVLFRHILLIIKAKVVVDDTS